MTAKKKTDIILDDVNLDFQSDLLDRSFMQGLIFVQLVSKPTHIRVGLIDYLHVYKDFCSITS